MGWLKSILDKVKEAATAEPIECPRGWGQVAFMVDLSYAWFMPWFELSRKCPIGDATSCSDCDYPFKPEDAQRLRENLSKLDALRKEKVLSESEYAIRRQMVIHLRDGTGKLPGEGFRIAAWIVGVPSLVVVVVGCWLTTRADPEAGAVVAILGGVTLAMSVSFAILAWTKRKAAADSSSTASRRGEPKPSRDPGSRAK